MEIPVLCRTSHFEQEWNVEALERMHAGRSLDEVRTAQEYQFIIKEWIGKKSNGSLRTLKIRMEEERRKLGKRIHEISESILKSEILV